MIVGVGIGVISYVRLIRHKKWTRWCLGGLLMLVLFLSITTIFSAGGWVYYTHPQSLEAATHEFKQALLGERCGI